MSNLSKSQQRFHIWKAFHQEKLVFHEAVYGDNHPDVISLQTVTHAKSEIAHFAFCLEFIEWVLQK